MKSRGMGLSFVLVFAILVWSLGACLAAETPQAAAPAKAADAKATPPAKTEAAAPAKAVEPAMPLPSGELTLGVAFGDQVFESFADVIVPVWAHKSGVVFVNPRGSANDAAEQECNIGLGARYLLKDKNIILGANVYYDSRWTAHDNQFDELGVGIELLSKWVDARANYYFGDDSKKVADTRVDTQKWDTYSSGTSYSDLYGEVNSIMQDTVYTKTKDSWTEKRTYQNFETGMEGWDAEIGAKLPILEKLAETRLFVGYQSFDNPFGDDLDGLTARVEVRALPGVTLDAKYFEEKELNGTQYYIGGRVQMPFDVANLAKGRNPFAGTLSVFKPATTPFANRLTEMVIRDMHVQMSQSEFSELVGKRQLSKRSKVVDKKVTENVIADGIAFVDGDTKDPLGAQNGSFEHPYSRIQLGVLKAAIPGDEIDVTYVMPVTEKGDRYNENVKVLPGVTVWGSGTPIQGYGGKSFGGGTRPIADGNGSGPTFTIMPAGDYGVGERVVTLDGNIRITGMDIRNTPSKAGIQASLLDPDNMIVVPAGGAVTKETDYYIGNAGIVANGANNYTIDNNVISGAGFGAVLVAPENSSDTFSIQVGGNTFENNYFGGLAIEGRGNGSGAFNPTIGDFDVYNSYAVGDTWVGGNTFRKNDGVNQTLADLIYDRSGGVVDLYQVGGNGLLVRGTGYQSADVNTYGNTAEGNRASGLNILVQTTGGNANIDMGYDTANANGLMAGLIPQLPRAGGDGISAVALADNGGSANVNIWGADASLNENDGIVAVANVANGSGSSDVDLDYCTVRGNLGTKGTGAYVSSVAQGSGNAYADIDDTTAIKNNSAGIIVDVQALGGGYAEVWLDDNTAFQNKGPGIAGSVNSSSSSAYAYLWDNLAEENSGPGIAVNVNGYGYAYLQSYYDESAGNDGAGIVTHVTSAQGQANVYLYSPTADSNGGVGIDALAASANSSAYGYASDVTSVRNNGNGVVLNVNAYSYAQGQLYGDLVALNNGNGAVLNVNSTYSSAEGYIGGSGLDLPVPPALEDAEVGAFVGNKGDGVVANVTAQNNYAYLYGSPMFVVGNSGAGVNAAVNAYYGAYGSLYGITADKNKGTGVNLDVASQYYWAQANLYSSSASGNKGAGFAVDVSTINPTYYYPGTYAYLGDLTANGNSGPGAAVRLDGYYCYAYLNNFGDNTMQQNGGPGLVVDVNASGYGYVYGGATAVNNDGPGAAISVSGVYGAYADLTGNYGRNNGHGLIAEVQTTYGTAGLDLYDVNAALNKGDGVHATVQSTEGYAYANLGGNDVEAKVPDGNGGLGSVNAVANQDDGVDIAVTGGAGGATLDVYGGMYSRNGGNGIVATVLAQNGGEAVATLSGGESSQNGANGLNLSVEDSHIYYDATLNVTDWTASDNGANGILAAVKNNECGAQATLTGITANRNGANGVALGVEGVCWADATLNDVVALRNGANGIAVGLEGESADLEIGNSAAAANGANGILADVSGSLYGAEATLSDVVAAGNRGGDGIHLDVTAGGEGSALLTMNAVQDVTFSGVNAALNASDGVEANVTATGSGNATMNVNGGRFIRNGGNGILANVTAEGGGEAVASLTGGESSQNGANGLNLSVEDSHIYNAATLNVTDWTASDNSANGILASVKNNECGAQATLTGITALNNGANGVALTVDGICWADATLNDVVALRNGANGIAVGLESVGDADLEINRAAVVANGANGILASVSSSASAADATLTDVIAAGNRGGDGINIGVTAAELGSASLTMTAGDGVTFRGVTVNGVNAALNSSDGVEANVTATGSGNATLTVNGGRFIRNDANGILANVTAQNGGVAAASLSGGVSSQNGANGIGITVSDLGVPTASLSVSDWTASGNGANGIAASVTTMGFETAAAAAFEGVEASGNGLDGILANLASASGSASASFTEVRALQNGQDGVDVTLDAANDANASFNSILVLRNGVDGILASITGDVTAELAIDTGAGLNNADYDLNATVIAPATTVTLENCVFWKKQILP